MQPSLFPHRRRKRVGRRGCARRPSAGTQAGPTSDPHMPISSEHYLSPRSLAYEKIIIRRGHLLSTLHLSPASPHTNAHTVDEKRTVATVCESQTLTFPSCSRPSPPSTWGNSNTTKLQARAGREVLRRPPLHGEKLSSLPSSSQNRRNDYLVALTQTSRSTPQQARPCSLAARLCQGFRPAIAGRE